MFTFSINIICWNIFSDFLFTRNLTSTYYCLMSDENNGIALDGNDVVIAFTALEFHKVYRQLTEMRRSWFRVEKSIVRRAFSYVVTCVASRCVDSDLTTHSGFWHRFQVTTGTSDVKVSAQRSRIFNISFCSGLENGINKRNTSQRTYIADCYISYNVYWL